MEWDLDDDTDKIREIWADHDCDSDAKDYIFQNIVFSGKKNPHSNKGISLECSFPFVI